MYSSVLLYFCFLLAWALRVHCLTPKTPDKPRTIFYYVYNGMKNAQQVWTCSWREVVLRMPVLYAFWKRLLWISSSLVLLTEHQLAHFTLKPLVLKAQNALPEYRQDIQVFSFFFFPPNTAKNRDYSFEMIHFPASLQVSKDLYHKYCTGTGKDGTYVTESCAESCEA